MSPDTKSALVYFSAVSIVLFGVVTALLVGMILAKQF